ncbi:hypothetical protein BGP77_05900 [Saccharospirillum sp. MSK14-1]|uniref:hypothetical protein n=1 Tax=Saccharospirillum sp. MSK14-1 TaxID=1897632 RepID=UPI000D3D3B7B|nr:hypothetical protein [Saccharospirillum sp. MSK14-1]PTY36817.1 hypothetical protein BGP77_05900 [Saccharospirillum sp. MSK14-1]
MLLNRCVFLWWLAVWLFCLFEPGNQAFAESGDRRIQSPIGQLVIHQPRIGVLFQLKGLKGDGYYRTRNAAGQLCEAEVSLVAGSFAGQSLGIGTAADVVIDVYSLAVSQHLLRVEEVVSDDYLVAYQPGISADMVVRSGLDASGGFILQPQPRWRSWWRLESKGNPCAQVND